MTQSRYAEDFDPALYCRNGLWYHPNETWSDEFGPFATRQAASFNLENYCRWLDGKPLLPITVDSSSWTGRDSTVHLGFKSKTQLDLIMIWRQYGTKSNGDCDYARVIWSTRHCLWNWQDRLRALIKMVWGYDQSKCSVCQGAVNSYPGNPFKKAYCEEHCPDHDYVHEPGLGKVCNNCGAHPPWDYYD